MARSTSGSIPEKMAELQESLKQAQGLAAAPQLLMQIKEQMDVATQLSASLADEYQRVQKRLVVLEGLAKEALSLAGYTDDMIEELQKELEG